MEVDLVPQRVKILMDIKERSCHLGQSSFSVSLLPIPCGFWFRGLNRDKSPCWNIADPAFGHKDPIKELTQWVFLSLTHENLFYVKAEKESMLSANFYLLKKK